MKKTKQMTSEYNLLTEHWIPVKGKQKISLKKLLCNSEKYSLELDRDDIELACLQMIVCMVQVVFMPEDLDQLQDFYNKPITGKGL